jgi:hypothetical protein
MLRARVSIRRRRPFGAFGGGGDGSVQQCIERGLLVGVECLEHPLFDSGERDAYLGESAVAGKPQGDRVAAPVLCRASALNEVGSLQLIARFDAEVVTISLGPMRRVPLWGWDRLSDKESHRTITYERHMM